MLLIALIGVKAYKLCFGFVGIIRIFRQNGVLLKG